MITCKNCNSVMHRTFVFEKGQSMQQYVCSFCGNATKPKPVLFDDNGKPIPTNYPTKSKQNYNRNNNKKTFDKKKEKKKEKKNK